MCRTNIYQRSLIFAIALAAHPQATAAEVAPGMLTIERFSAERGDPNSQFFMGQRFEQGDGGVPKDMNEALAWYRKAAEQGHGPAQFKVGQFYEQGLAGLSPRPDVAEQWYGKAAQNGSKLARERFAERERSEIESEQRAKREAEAEAERRRKAELERQRRAALEQQRRRAAAAAAPEEEVDRGPKLSPEQLLEHVAAGPWREAKNRPAEFLPTGDMNCLRSGEHQVTCFSEERTRTVSNFSLTFTVKAVLQGFSSDGFNVHYVYNVLEKDSVSGDAGRDPYGLGLKRGWQQPGLAATCRLQAMSRLECEGAGFGKREFRAD